MMFLVYKKVMNIVVSCCSRFGLIFWLIFGGHLVSTQLETRAITRSCATHDHPTRSCVFYELRAGFTRSDTWSGTRPYDLISNTHKGRHTGCDMVMRPYFKYPHGQTHWLVHSCVSLFWMFTQSRQMSHGRVTLVFKFFQLSFKLFDLFQFSPELFLNWFLSIESNIWGSNAFSS